MLNLKCIPGKRGKLFALILYLIAVLLIVPAYSIDISVGMDAPDFTLVSSEGKVVPLSDYKGNVLVLIYLRMDQDRSLQALKDGNDVFEQLKDQGVHVIGITSDTESVNIIHKIIVDYNIEYPLLLDWDRNVFGAYGIHVYPSTIIIDRSGKIAHSIPSHPLTYKTILEGHIRYVIGEIDEKKMLEIVSPKNEQVKSSVFLAIREYNLALKFTEERLFDMAVNAVTKSIEADKGLAQSHILLGFLYLEENETDKAFAEFNEALKLDPHSHDAKTGLGGALILKNDIDNAIELLTEAASANPYPEMTYYELGRAYEIKGEDSTAKEMYKKALQKIIHKKVLPSAVSRCR